MSPDDSGSIQVLVENEPGMPDVSRRLSDKILSAFNHAYAIGETDIADRLKAVLEHAEQCRGGCPEHRAGHDPVGQAGLWIEFVEARNQYRTASEARDTDAGEVDEALERMKRAYKRWSQS